MSRIFIVGSINQDIVVTAERAPLGGETVFGRNVEFHPGGKGANQAVAAQLYSGNATFVGRVGADAFGESLVEYLSSRGVTTSISLDKQSVTGTALIVVERSGENRIIVVPGANAALSIDDCQTLKQLAPNDFVIVQNEIFLNTVQAVLETTKRAGATTVFNVAPAAQLSKHLLGLTDLLIVNRHEFESVFQEPLREDPVDQLLAQHQTHKCSIVLTLGANGAVAAADGAVLAVSGEAVSPLDTTGAGDCFVGALVAGLAHGEPFSKSMEFANCAAGASVTRSGASESFFSRDELMRLKSG